MVDLLSPTIDLLEGAQWTVVRTAPDAAANPADLAALSPAEARWLPGTVPGTAASAWRDEFGTPAALELVPEDWDWWFLADFTAVLESNPAWRLRSDGIATYSTLWLNDAELGSGSGGFDAVDFPAEPQPGNNHLAIRCRPLSSVATPAKPRARWRSSLIADGTLRWHRTPLLGHIPWHGTVPAVGPWTQLSLSPLPPFEVLSLRTEFDGETGRVLLTLSSEAPVQVSMRLSRDDGNGDSYDGDPGVEKQITVHGSSRHSLDITAPEPWFPHSHGTPARYRFELRAGSARQTFELGFRSVAVDRHNGGFQLEINGLPVFARGAVWAPLDALSLGAAPARYRSALAKLVEAGINMIRISGTGSYEQPAFYRECDRLGILVWQDCMLATLDPPEEPEWLERFGRESATWLTRLAKHPSVVVVSGGNETEQQPVFWGKSPEQRTMTVLETVIPRVISQRIPAAIAVSSSPSGEGNPIQARNGISHYFGVGAYQLPLADARNSGVRFAAECLAFAIPPEPSSIAKHFGDVGHLQHFATARWQAAIARDPGADWNFEDTLAHYTREFFGPDPEESMARTLDLHRAAAHHAIGRTLVEWRRPESPCAGALILSAHDLAAGAGFGIVDVDGVPKSAWYAVKNTCKPLAIAFHPEGLNGVDLHVFNDLPEPVEATMTIQINGISGAIQAQAEFPVQLPGHSARNWQLHEVLGGFLDLDHIWKFGERSYDSAEAVLRTSDGTILAQSVLLLGGIDRQPEDTGLTATSGNDGHGEFIEVHSRKLASFVALDVPGRVPEDNYFHLPAGGRRRISCQRVPDADTALQSPWGTVRALNDPMAPQPIRHYGADELTQGDQP